MAKNHTQYIFSMGELKRKDNSINFKNKKGNNYIPIEDLKEIYCLSEVSLNSKFLDFISKARIVIHFFNYNGNYIGTFYPKKQLISGKLIIAQTLTYADSKKRLKIAKAIVQGIADNIREVLYHYYRHRNKNRKELKENLDWLKSDE